MPRRVLMLALAMFAPMSLSDKGATAQEPDARLDRAIRRTLDLEAYDLQALAVPANERRAFSVALVLDGALVDIDLAPASVRTVDFEVWTRDERGVMVAPPLPPETTYRGRVRQRPGALVAASIIHGGLRARIVEGGRQWGIQPLRETTPGADPALHVVYRGEDIVVGDWTCAAEVLPVPGAEPAGRLAAASAGGGTCANIAELAFDADVEFFEANGSSIPDTVADIESIANAVNIIYERDVSITHVIPRIVVRTSEPDGYVSTVPDELLAEFELKWEADHSPGSADFIHRDVAHLMTGKDLNSSVIGIAWLFAICDTLDPADSNGHGYGLSQSRFSSNFASRVALTAHELGHNWGAGHCNGDPDCRIMCAGLGGCSGVIESFGTTSITAISNYRDARSCLTSEEPPAVDCNFNCIDDNEELAAGTAGDCNFDGVLDSCEIAAGMSGDCDVNGVPDSCEDCNGNGLADACDLSVIFEDDSGELAPFGFFTDVSHRIVAPPVATGDVILEFTALGSYDFGSDNVEVTLNSSSPPWVVFDTTTGGNNCPILSGPDQVILGAAEFNALVNGGNAVFTFHTEAAFLPDDCGGAWIRMTTTYPGVNDADSNDNGILDICECDADCATAGPDTDVDIDDLLDLLANWGNAGGCDIAPTGGDGVIGIDDLLGLLGAWGTCAP